MRFSLRELASAPAHALSAGFRSRLLSLRQRLDAQPLPEALSSSSEHLRRGLTKAIETEADLAALGELESGTASAVATLRLLPEEARTGGPAQDLLGTAFGCIVAQRAILHAAAPADDLSRPLLAPTSELGDLLADTVEDARAFCREKYGDSPDTRVQRVAVSGAAPCSPSFVLLPPFVSFPLHEILKNAMGAHCRRVGADQLDKLPSITVRHGIHGDMGFVGVTDFGGGLLDEPSAVQRFLHTTNAERAPRLCDQTPSRSHRVVCV